MSEVIKFTFSSRLTRGAGPDWGLIVINRKSHEPYAHQTEFTSREDAYHAAELVITCMQAADLLHIEGCRP